MQLPKRKLADTPLRPEPHVQQVIEKEILPNLPDPEPIRETRRLNVDVDFDVYTEAHIKARRQGKKLSEVVRGLLAEYLSK
jgi:hypothetical protein